MTRRATVLFGLTMAAFAAACERSAKQQIVAGTAGPEKTLTGCLQRGDDGKSFVIRVAQTDVAANQPQKQQPDKPTQEKQPAMYRVVAPSSVQLSAHLGERVSVTGNTIEVPVNVTDEKGLREPVGTTGRTPSNDPDAGAPKRGMNTMPRDKRTDIADVPVLRVARINEVEGSCGDGR